MDRIAIPGLPLEGGSGSANSTQPPGSSSGVTKDYVDMALKKKATAVNVGTMKKGDDLPDYPSNCVYNFYDHPCHGEPYTNANRDVLYVVCAYHLPPTYGDTQEPVMYYVFLGKKCIETYTYNQAPEEIKTLFWHESRGALTKILGGYPTWRELMNGLSVKITTIDNRDYALRLVKRGNGLCLANEYHCMGEWAMPDNLDEKVVSLYTGDYYPGEHNQNALYEGTINTVTYNGKDVPVSVQLPARYDYHYGPFRMTMNFEGMGVSLTEKVNRNIGIMGPYSDREPIELTLEERDMAISRSGQKVSKPGWAICSFIGRKGDVYSFNPGVMDGDVCIFSEEITKKESRPIEYKYVYDEDGLPLSATATYNGSIHSYTFHYEKNDEGGVVSEHITDDQTGATLNALPYQYQSTVGTYHPLTVLNESAELPLDHHCRLISHFQGEGTIRVTVSFNVATADLNLLVFRDGLIANLATQLGTIYQMISETNKALLVVEQAVESLDVEMTEVLDERGMDGNSGLPLMCGQPSILFGAGTPQEAVVPDNWKQFDPETGEGYNWNGEPSSIGQQYINTSATTGGRYIAVRMSYDKTSSGYWQLKWQNC